MEVKNPYVQNIEVNVLVVALKTQCVRKQTKVT